MIYPKCNGNRIFHRKYTRLTNIEVGKRIKILPMFNCLDCNYEFFIIEGNGMNRLDVDEGKNKRYLR